MLAARHHQGAGPLVADSRWVPAPRPPPQPVGSPAAKAAVRSTMAAATGLAATEAGPARCARRHRGGRRTAASAHRAAYQGRHSPLNQVRSRSGSAPAGQRRRQCRRHAARRWRRRSGRGRSAGSPGVRRSCRSRSCGPAIPPAAPRLPSAHGPWLPQGGARQVLATRRPACSQPRRKLSAASTPASRSPTMASTVMRRALAMWSSSVTKGSEAKRSA